MKRCECLLLGATLLSFAACTRTRSDTTAVAQTTAAGVAASAASPAVAPAPSPVIWQLERQYGYQLKLTTALDFGNDNRAFDFDLTGKVRVAPIRVPGAELALYLTIDDAKIVSRVHGSQPTFDKIAAEVSSTGCLVEFASGRLHALRVSPALSAMSANIYRELGADLQFAGGDGQQYEADEYDTTGRYVAQYAAQSDPLHWKKHKLRYSEILAPASAAGPSRGPSRIVPTVESSSGDLELSPAGRLSVVHAKNQVLVSGAQMPVRSITTLTLDSSTEQAAPAGAGLDWNTLLSKTVRVDAGEPYAGQASVDSLDTARIQGQTFETLWARLQHQATPQALAAAQGAPGAAPNAQSPALTASAQDFIALSALFRKKPETIALAVEKIRANAAGADLLLDALASASSPQSEQALLALADAKGVNPKLQARARYALTRVQRPTDAAVNALKQRLVSRPFDESALFGLGTYSRRLRDAGSQEQSAAIGEFLLEQLRAAKTEPELIAALGGLTNSGYANALPAVRGYLRDSREAVRAAAVQALQSMRDPAVDGILAASLKTDPSSEVRISAMAAAQVRQPTDEVAGALSTVALSSRDAQVRFRAVELMLQWLGRRPDLRGTLATVASNDPEPRVRERAKTAL